MKISDILTIFTISTDDSADKLSGLAKKRVRYIINHSSVTSNVFPANFFYINIEKPEHLDNEETMLILKEWIEKADSNNKILLHSETETKTRIMFVRILIKLFDKTLDDIVQNFENFCENVKTMDNVDAYMFYNFTDEELAELGYKKYLSIPKKQKHPTVPNNTPVDNVENLESLMANIDFNDSSLNSFSTDYRSDDTVRSPIPQKVMRLIDDYEETVSSNSSPTTRTEDYDQIMSIINKPFESDTVHDMLNSGMSVDDIINFLL